MHRCCPSSWSAPPAVACWLSATRRGTAAEGFTDRSIHRGRSPRECALDPRRHLSGRAPGPRLRSGCCPRLCRRTQVSLSLSRLACYHTDVGAARRERRAPATPRCCSTPARSAHRLRRCSIAQEAAANFSTLSVPTHACANLSPAALPCTCASFICPISPCPLLLCALCCAPPSRRARFPPLLSKHPALTARRPPWPTHSLLCVPRSVRRCVCAMRACVCRCGCGCGVVRVAALSVCCVCPVEPRRRRPLRMYAEWTRVTLGHGTRRRGRACADALRRVQPPSLPPYSARWRRTAHLCPCTWARCGCGCCDCMQ